MQLRWTRIQPRITCAHELRERTRAPRASNAAPQVDRKPAIYAVIEDFDRALNGKPSDTIQYVVILGSSVVALISYDPC